MMRAMLAALAVVFYFTPAVAMEDRSATTCIVVHHSATEAGNVEVFRRNHQGKGWDDVGYHFVVANGKGGPDGEIQKGRPEKAIGAHAKGRNSDSVGVCLVGEDKFTTRQKDALILLLVDLCRRYKINPTERTIQGHHEKCPGPGLDLGDVVAKVREKLKQSAVNDKAASPWKRPVSLQFLVKTGRIDNI